MDSAPARSPEACSRANSHLPSRSRSSKRLDGPYRLVEPLIFLKPQRASQPREPTYPDILSPPYIYVRATALHLLAVTKPLVHPGSSHSPPSLLLGRQVPSLTRSDRRSTRLKLHHQQLARLNLPAISGSYRQRTAPHLAIPLPSNLGRVTAEPPQPIWSKTINVGPQHQHRHCRRLSVFSPKRSYTHPV